MADAFRFAAIGDHRGDNKAWDKVTWARYTDDGITKPALMDIATALKGGVVEFVLDVGDLVTKWTPQLTYTTADSLFSAALKDWADLWRQLLRKSSLVLRARQPIGQRFDKRLDLMDSNHARHRVTPGQRP